MNDIKDVSTITPQNAKQIIYKQQDPERRTIYRIIFHQKMGILILDQKQRTILGPSLLSCAQISIFGFKLSISELWVVQKTQ